TRRCARGCPRCGTTCARGGYHLPRPRARCSRSRAIEGAGSPGVATGSSPATVPGGDPAAWRAHAESRRQINRVVGLAEHAAENVLVRLPAADEREEPAVVWGPRVRHRGAQAEVRRGL